MKKLLLWCLLPLMVFGQNMLKNTGFEEKGENGMPLNWGSHCTGGSTAGMTTETSYSGQACGYIVKIVDGKSHVAAITQGRLDHVMRHDEEAGRIPPGYAIDL